MRDKYPPKNKTPFNNNHLDTIYRGFQSEDVVRDVIATGGVPMGRWKEGLLFEGIEPQPWLKSAAN